VIILAQTSISGGEARLGTSPGLRDSTGELCCYGRIGRRKLGGKE
jgi:hypothetical protein